MPAPEISALPVQGAYIADKKAAIKGALELGNVDNTSDVNKPVSTLTQTALDLKADASALTSGLATKAASSHTHAQSEVTGLEAAITLRVKSDTAQAGAGSVAVLNIVTILEADYNNLVTPDEDTVYIITEP